MRSLGSRATAPANYRAVSFFCQNLAARVKMKLDNETIFLQAAVSYILSRSHE